MRINRPDGISQENRSHPFFILLRKFADIQRDEAEKTAKVFLSSSLMCMIVSILTNAILFLNPLLMVITIPLVIINAFTIYHRYQNLQDLLASNSFKEVDQMIYSNDFQTTNLNMEKMINEMTRCTEITGKMVAFQELCEDRKWYTINICILCVAFGFISYYFA